MKIEIPHFKYSVKVRKYIDIEIPVEAACGDDARQVIGHLQETGDTAFMFDGAEDWKYDILFIRRVSDEEFENLASDTEVVKHDGTHSWR